MVKEMVLVEIFEVVRELKLVESRYEFSEEWLGRCRSYFSAIVSSKREPSIAALTTLKVRLEAVLREAGDKSAEQVHSAEDERIRLALEQLICWVENIIAERCAAEMPDAIVQQPETSSNSMLP